MFDLNGSHTCKSWLSATFALVLIVCPATAGELHKAARKGDLDKLAILITEGYDLNELDAVVGGALHWAAARGHLKVTSKLVEAGAIVDLEANPPDRLTPLQLASSAGHFDVVKFLVRAGAHIEAGTDMAGTPLHLAAQSNHADIARFLLESGANSEATAGDILGTYPIQWAAKEGSTDVMKVFLEEGIPVDMAQDDGTTSLHLAVYYSQFEMVELLVSKGADPFANSEYWNTPVFLSHTNPEMTALFESLGIPFNE